MAEMKDPRGKRPAAGKQDSVFSHPPDANMAEGKGAPAVLRRGSAKAKKKSWLQQNQTLAIGLAVGGGVLVILVVLAAFGLFGSNSGAKPIATPPVAGRPVAPPPQPAPSQPAAQPAAAQPAAAQPTAGQTVADSSHPGGTSMGVRVPSLGQPAPGQAPPSGPSKEEPKKEQKLLLPDDVANWKPPDYKLARRYNHPKLLEAIAHLGEKKFSHSENAAKCLVDLLRPLPAEKSPGGLPAGTPTTPSTPQPQPGGRRATPGVTPPGGVRGVRSVGGPSNNPSATPGATPGASPSAPPSATPDSDGPRPYTPGDLATLVETIIEALGGNDCELARGTLAKVLGGTFATDDDKTAVEATLKTLLAHPSDEGDALLLRAATAARDLRSLEHEGPWAAKDLEAKAFELLKQSASFGLRTKLAAATLDKHPRLMTGDPVTDFLLSPSPLNCGAQVLIYEKSDVKKNKELRATLEKQFVTYSSAAMARCLDITAENLPAASIGPTLPSRPAGGGRPLGVRPVGKGGAAGGLSPPAATPPSTPSEPLKASDANLGPQIAQQLWTGEFSKFVESQVGEIHALDKLPELTLLAASIPQDSARAVMAKLLKTRWYEGPKALEAAGLLDRAITDPALLPIIKKAGKRKESGATKLADALRRGGRPAGPGAPGGVKSEALQKKQQAEQDWMDVSAKLAAAWCKRFGSAPSKDSDDSSDKPAGDSAELKPPSGFALPASAKVVASHHVVLPDGAPAGFPQVQASTLEVYYFRIEESAKPTKAIKHYVQQALAKQKETRVFEDKYWIESCMTTPQKDRLRSVDVLITPSRGIAASAPEKGKPRAAEDEDDLTVEVLIIEINESIKAATRDSLRE